MMWELWVEYVTGHPQLFKTSELRRAEFVGVLAQNALGIDMSSMSVATLHIYAGNRRLAIAPARPVCEAVGREEEWRKPMRS